MTSAVTEHPTPTAAEPRPRSTRAAARAALRDENRRHAVVAVQRALDRRDNGGSFGH
ncbi:hypothetical protein [Streptomyces sp. B6B3]|uniref:hypothetical protein n=1 Tax=Streptomyces sp. B6B3 TaxID=3153570 RepID=UPI00325F5DEA